MRRKRIRGILALVCTSALFYLFWNSSCFLPEWITWEKGIFRPLTIRWQEGGKYTCYLDVP